MNKSRLRDEEQVRAREGESDGLRRSHLPQSCLTARVLSSHAESALAHRAPVSARERWTENMKEERASGQTLSEARGRQDPVRGSVGES